MTKFSFLERYLIKNVCVIINIALSEFQNKETAVAPEQFYLLLSIYNFT